MPYPNNYRGDLAGGDGPCPIDPRDQLAEALHALKLRLDTVHDTVAGCDQDAADMQSMDRRLPMLMAEIERFERWSGVVCPLVGRVAA